MAAPSIFFDPGTQLMPSCAPGVCTVRIIPDQTGNTDKFLQTDGLGTIDWANVVLATSDIPALDMSKITTGNLSWSRVTSTPTTLAGYGITDTVVNSFNGRTGTVTLSASDVTSTLGYVPYNASNPAGYISSSSIASSTDVSLAALASGNFLKYNGTFWTNVSIATSDIPALDMSKITTGSLSWSRVTSTPTTLAGYGVTDLIVNSFNGRSGTVTLNSADVTTTLGYTPYNSSNPNGYISSSSIASSTDVLLASLVAGNFLKYNGSKWINTAIATSDVPNLDMSKITTGSLSWSRVTSTPTTLAGYGITDLVVNTFNGRSGTVILNSADVTTTLGYTPYNSTNPANYITLTGLSATAPLLYSSSTGAFSIPKASSTADGYLAATDWSTFNAKLTSVLNSGKIFVGSSSNVAAEVTLSGDATLSNSGVLTIATSAINSAKILDGSIFNLDLASSSFLTSLGTTGTDINFSGTSTALGGTLTLNLPDAAAAARGLVSTGTQTIAGDKTLSGSTTFSGNVIVNSAIASGNTLTIVANSLTSGSGLSLTSSSTGLTGDLAKIGLTGASATGTALNVTNAGTGLTLRINDDGTYTDSSPFAIDAAGNVGIGTITPGSNFQVTGDMAITSGGTFRSAADFGNYFMPFEAITGRMVLRTGGADRLSITYAGNVGIGTTTPAYALHVNGSAAGAVVMGIRSSSTTGYPGIEYADASGTVNLYMGYDNTNAQTRINSVNNKPIRMLTNSIDALFIGNNQRIGLGTTTPATTLHVVGKITASAGFNGQCLTVGSFSVNLTTSCNMDVAESYATFEATEPGDVVAIPPHESQALVIETNSSSSIVKIGRSTGASGETVLGVVSSNPGLVFKDGLTYLSGANDQLVTATSTVVALVGRVPVRISLENGPIQAGDELAASPDIPGAAVRAIRPGFTIGIALQDSVAAPGPADSDMPQILIFVNPRWSLGSLTNVDAIASSTDVMDQFTAYVQHALHAIGITAKNGVATLQELVAHKITTHELCLDDTCVTGGQLQQLIQQNSMPSVAPSPVAPSVTLPPDVPSSTAVSSSTVVDQHPDSAPQDSAPQDDNTQQGNNDSNEN